MKMCLPTVSDDKILMPVSVKIRRYIPDICWRYFREGCSEHYADKFVFRVFNAEIVYPFALGVKLLWERVLVICEKKMTTNWFFVFSKHLTGFS